MKLLIVTPFYKPAYRFGGPTRSIPALSEGLSRLGVDVTVYTTNANGKSTLEVDANTRLDADGVSVFYFERDIQNSFFYSRKLAQACHETINHFDCVYVSSNWGYPFIPACRAALRHAIPYIVTPRTSLMRKTWRGKYLKKMVYHRLVERRLINQASLLHYTTQLEVDESHWLGLKPDYCIVPNPVDVSEFDQMPSRGLWRKALNVQSDTPIILYLGRIEARKGLDITVRSFAEVHKYQQDALLVLAGPEEDGYYAELRTLSTQLGVAKYVRYTGYIDAQTRLQALADADVFVLTSYSENFGMAVVEAMAAGLPVVISDQVGIAPDLKASNVGIVTPLDPQATANALGQLLTSSKERKVLGKRAMLFAREKYSPEIVALSMLSHFARVAI